MACQFSNGLQSNQKRKKVRCQLRVDALIQNQVLTLLLFHSPAQGVPDTKDSKALNKMTELHAVATTPQAIRRVWDTVTASCHSFLGTHAHFKNKLRLWADQSCLPLLSPPHPLMNQLLAVFLS